MRKRGLADIRQIDESCPECLGALYELDMVLTRLREVGFTALTAEQHRERINEILINQNKNP
jgi:hypothetical protein